MKKILTLLLAIMATTCLWAYGFNLGDLTYSITSSSEPYTAEVSAANSYAASIIIPETVTYDGITYSVTSIGKYAFQSCHDLISVTIPKSITSIKYLAFDWCTSLSKTNYTGNIEEWCNIEFEDYWGNPLSQSSNFYINDQIVKELLIPNSVDSIHDYAFAGGSFTSIVCESTTPPILGIDALPYCVVYIPDNTLTAYQTSWGTNRTYVNNETKLAIHVDIPGTLSDKIFDAGKRPIQIINLIVTGNLNEDDFACMRETMTSLVEVDLSGVTNTSGVNFYGKSSLLKIILPNNLTSIEYQAFYNCNTLTSIVIPNSVMSIGECAFYECTSLPSMSIPNSVTSIGARAFTACYSLASITIGNSVTSIGEHAFRGCSSLSSITIPNSVTSMGNSAFAYCRSLASITIGNSVTGIGEEAFMDCSSLTSITIPNSVTSIGEGAFSGCSSLTSITIGNSVTSIGHSAFYTCYFLTSITCLGTTPPDASDLAANTSTCKLIVPHSAYNAYLRHAYWGQFLNIISGYAVTLHTNNEQWGEVTGDGLYTNDTTITITATPYEGYTFLHWSDGNTDNPRTLTVTKDITLTAEFAIEGGCLVTFVDWDGTVLSSVSVAPGEAATAPADPTREGYTFIGWDKDFSAVTDHMTVTAQYQINRYRVRFFDDDTLLKTDSVEYQSAAVAPANPYHEGYTFTGWDKSFESITADLDIYAQYEMGENRELTVIYTNSEDNDSEISSHSVVFKIPAAPEIEGFTFLYWQPVAEPITNVITIQAIYEADEQSSAPEVYTNPTNPVQKLLRNGQVYILQDGKTYNVMGQEL